MKKRLKKQEIKMKKTCVGTKGVSQVTY